jgi:hypothetical protein
MTEILGSGDEPPDRYVPNPANEALRFDLPDDAVDRTDGTEGTDDIDDIDGEEYGGPYDARAASPWRDVLEALTEPASLAVASVLCTLAAVIAGPSYRYDTYPFNEGVGSLAAVFSQLSVVHPLHGYLTTVAPTAALVVAALVTSLLALVRARRYEDEPGWVRAAAGGALLVALVLAGLVALGAYRTSTYDLRVPQTASSFTSG